MKSTPISLTTNSMSQQQTKYVDGYVFVVPKNKVSKYRKMAREGADLWMRNGALTYRECIGDDLDPDMGGMNFSPFPKMTRLKENETVWFSYIEYKSKAHRNQVNKKVMKGMEEYQKDHPEYMKDMPMDMKRFAFGGFKVQVTS